jgi:site-specific recombinase XerD
MATVIIQKRNRKKGIRYLLYYKDPFSGKKRYYRTLNRLRDAQQVGNDLRALLNAGKVSEVMNTRKRLSLLKLEEVSCSLRAFWKGRMDRSEISGTTFRGYCDRLKLIEEEFGEKLLCEISHDAILEYRNRIASETSNLTSNRSLFIFKQIFKHALDLNAVNDDPAKGISNLSEKKHVRNRFLVPHQLELLIHGCQELRFRHCFPAIIYLGAEHGASKQEILDLKWSDIDFDFSGIGLITFFRTKTKRQRTEYLMPRTKLALLKWQTYQDFMRRKKKVEDKGLGFVFCRLDGTRLKGFDKSWRNARRIAGFAGFHFHDLRHTFCSNMVLSGADLKDVKEMIGHKDLRMTDRYTHLTSMRKHAKQVELARFYEEHSSIKESSGEDIGVTKC